MLPSRAVAAPAGMPRTANEIREIVFELDDAIRFLERQRFRLKQLADALEKAEKDTNADKGANDNEP
jgi:hypothetical protein